MGFLVVEAVEIYSFSKGAAGIDSFAAEIGFLAAVVELNFFATGTETSFFPAEAVDVGGEMTLIELTVPKAENFLEGGNASFPDVLGLIQTLL
jgi:hypothetical protein